MDFTRQYDICTPHLIESTSVAVVGTGGIGAAAAVALAKLGVGFLYLYDPDKVELVNIPNQMLRSSDIGKSKVFSVAGLITELTDGHGRAFPRAVGGTDNVPGDIILSALDSIDARKEVYACWKYGCYAEWYLDARMGAELFQLYTVRRGDTEWYEKALYPLSDETVPDDPCTAKATIYTAFIAAGHIAHAVKRIVMSQEQPRLIQHDIKGFSLVMP